MMEIVGPPLPTPMMEIKLIFFSSKKAKNRQKTQKCPSPPLKVEDFHLFLFEGFPYPGWIVLCSQDKETSWVWD